MGLHKLFISKELVVVIFLVMAVFSLYAQEVDSRIFSLEKKKGSTADLIEHIQEQTGFVISYSSRMCQKDNIRLSSSNNTLIGFLEEIFADCPFIYYEREKRIIVRPKKISEKTFSITGFVRDAQTGERLLGANVFDEKSQSGTATNYHGFYSISLPGGNHQLQASYVGYDSDVRSLMLSADTVINFSLAKNIQLAEVSVIGSRMPDMLEGHSFNSSRIGMEQVADAPAFFGEPDLMRGLQMLPGVQSGAEGFTGLFVRGGGPDQNLILLDDAPIYNVGHLLGFFSIFNTNAVKQVSVTKDGFPARYGGRLSSVVDVRMKDGRKDRIGGNVSLGLLSSGVSLDGPVYKDKSTFAVSFRRTYVDVLAALYQMGDEEKTNYYFYDLNGKINYEFSDRSKVFFSSYLGRDKFYTLYNFRDVHVNDNRLEETVGINDESNAGWGNFTGSVRWNYVFNSRLFANFTGTFSDYRFFIGLKRSNEEEAILNTYKQRYLSGIRDYTLKSDFEFFPSPDYTIRFGGSGVVHRFNPGIDIIRSVPDDYGEDENIVEDVRIGGEEFRAYFENELSVGERWSGNAGLHSAFFLGNNKPYWSIEPRLALEYELSPVVSLRGTFSAMSQFVHLVGTAGFSLPTDLWLPISDEIEPMHSQQQSVGADFALGINQQYRVSVDFYRKNYKNLLSYKESTGFFDYSTSWEDKLSTGQGNSEGAEFLFQKNKGKLTGWIGYTFANSNVIYEELNDGEPFSARFDRQHDASVFVNYKFSKDITGSLTWLFGSGTPITLPEEKYYAPRLPFADTPEYGYSESVQFINNYRMPSFHRLDLGVNFSKKVERGERTWSFGLINAYGRQNPFILYFSESENAPVGSAMRQLKQLSLFPFPIPYIKYSFAF